MDNPKPPIVLVVDDIKPAAEMLSRLFATNGYEPITVYSGQDALHAVATHMPDLILLDVMMPMMSGLDVLRTLRENPQTADIPTILVTADERSTTLEQGMDLGADDFIKKPIEPREVLARAKSKIEAHLLRKSLRDRTRDLEALLRVGEELNSQLVTTRELLPLLLHLLTDLLPCQIAAVYHFDEQTGDLKNYEAHYNNGQSYNDTIDLTPIQHDLQNTNQLLVWHNHPLSTLNLPYGMAFMLQHSDHLHGLIVILSDESFDRHHQRLLEGIGRQATLAIRNAAAYELELRYTEKLETTVEERTRELRSAQNMLIQTEKLASVGRLAAGIAHEINNPLMPIIVNLEHMAEDLQDGLTLDARDVQHTLQSAQRIKRIVQRLLQFIRPSHSNRGHMEEVNIAQVINDIIALSHKAFDKANITTHTDLTSDLCIMGNKDQIEQVFLNLMLNAKSAMQPGGQLRIRSWQQNHGDKAQVVIEFEDNGSGIDPQIIDKIFEPFVGTRDDSNGLGLFISYEIVTNHSGSIDVQSQPGAGTVFTLHFPLITATS